MLWGYACMTSQVSAQVKPAWAGEDWLSRFVNLLIRTKPIYAVMKSQARRVMIKTAQKNDILWEETVQELESAIAHTGTVQTLANISNPNITAYPS